MTINAAKWSFEERAPAPARERRGEGRPKGRPAEGWEVSSMTPQLLAIPCDLVMLLLSV